MALHPFGTAVDGSPVTEVTLTIASGATASILDFGAAVRDVRIPDSEGRLNRVVLGYRDLAGYLADRGYLGVIAGRHANRIAGGRFELDGRLYQLTRNEQERTHLHGGAVGFGKRHWRIAEHDGESVSLALASGDGDEGYPGRLEVTCTYHLVAPATLTIEITATTDTPTIVNLVPHCYFNLSYGHSIRDHLLQVNASNYTPTDENLIPSGEIRAVTGTTYDFRAPRPIEMPGMASNFVYDINFVLDGAHPGLLWAATIADPNNRLWMEVHTSEAGMQFYDGSYLNASYPDLDGQAHFRHAGFCLEPGRFPDGPNHANFPSPVLRPDAIYRHTTEYRFGSGPANWRRLSRWPLPAAMERAWESKSPKKQNVSNPNA